MINLFFFFLFFFQKVDTVKQLTVKKEINILDSTIAKERFDSHVLQIHLIILINSH